jgi:cyclopropane-fatty-acyl-phospholipid synthase
MSIRQQDSRKDSSTQENHRPDSKLNQHAAEDARQLSLARQLLGIILQGYCGAAAVDLWNGERVAGPAAASTVLQVNKPDPLRDMLYGSNLNRLAESYLAGDLGYQGSLERIFDIIDFLQHRRFSASEKARLIRLLLAMHWNPGAVLANGKSTIRRDSNSQRTISHHYDVDNSFYQLVLDPEMIYSCAYYANQQQSLAQAQHNKLHHICRKLMLQPGETLLDIGCGWGGLAIWAATHYGVKVHGITLSERQLAYGQERVQQLGLGDRITLELRDYRALAQDLQFDKIVSVGMFEHIGVSNFPLYFSTVQRLLKPGGLFLNHGITNDTGWQALASSRFINEYIFPDGELARVSDVTNAMEQAKFEILDVEALRPHYAMTLRHWMENLLANKEQTIAIAGIRTWRLWRLYMAGSAYFFNKGNLGLYQILAGKNRHPWPLPLSRSHLYR